MAFGKFGELCRNQRNGNAAKGLSRTVHAAMPATFSPRGGGNELALLRSEVAALRAQLASASIQPPAVLDPADNPTVEQANEVAKAWAASARAARSYASALESKAAETAAFARQLETAQNGPSNSEGKSPASAAPNTEAVREMLQTEAKANKAAMRAAEDARAKVLEEERIKAEAAKAAAKAKAEEEAKLAETSAAKARAKEAKTAREAAEKAAAEKEKAEAAARKILMEEKAAAKAAEERKQAEIEKKENEKKAARERVAQAEKAAAERQRLKKEREEKEIAEKAAAEERAKEMERERIRLAKQELSEAHHRAAEMALAEQCRVCESAETTPHKVRSKTGIEWESHCGGPAMLDLLESTDLVDAQYLITLGNNGGILPKWQELPEQAKITQSNAWRLHCWGGSYCLPVLVLSHCWMDNDHPDRYGETLARVVPILELMLARAKTFGGHATIGVYWDYSSIPQKPFQSADEQSRFSNAMHEMPKWFAHPHTIVLMMSQPLPPRTDQQLVDEMEYENTRDYYERGYPYFERSVAALIKDPTCLWDYAEWPKHFADGKGGGKTGKEAPTFSDLKTKMRVKRPPPLSPVRFRAELKSRVNAGELTFSVKMDQVTVCGLYDTIFVKAFEEYAYMTSTLADAEAHLFYTDCGWGDKEAELLAEALEALADKAHPLGTRHISCRRDNNFSEAGIQRLMKARTYARRAEAGWLALNLDAKAGPAPRRGSVEIE